MIISALSLNDVLFLLKAALVTLMLCSIALAIGALIAVIIGLARTFPFFKPLNWIGMAYIELFRSTPLLMMLFLIYFGLALAGLDVPRGLAAGMALSLWTGSYLGDIVRSGIESIPKGQWEASTSLGMGYIQQMRHVVIPQAIKIMTPSTIGFITQLVKGSSLVYVLGYVELTRAGSIVVMSTFQPLLVYTIVALIYFGINYPLSRLGKRIESRLSQKRS